MLKSHSHDHCYMVIGKLIKHILSGSFEGDKTYVQVLTSPAEAEEQTFERREVKIGLSDGINIEITEGVTADDQIRGAREEKK